MRTTLSKRGNSPRYNEWVPSSRIIRANPSAVPLYGTRLGKDQNDSSSACEEFHKNVLYVHGSSMKCSAVSYLEFLKERPQNFLLKWYQGEKQINVNADAPVIFRYCRSIRQYDLWLRKWSAIEKMILLYSLQRVKELKYHTRKTWNLHGQMGPTAPVNPRHLPHTQG